MGVQFPEKYRYVTLEWPDKGLILLILTVNVLIIIGFLGRVSFSHGSTILTLISHYDSIGYKLYYRKTWFSYVVC